ncbi:hypothetical protein H0H87_012627 [Tephrocybe sp. NHM501043]|nr:hypothetical protein H0H87_012627 [Tephrocybe sp. NHM501043]
MSSEKGLLLNPVERSRSARPEEAIAMGNGITDSSYEDFLGTKESTGDAHSGDEIGPTSTTIRDFENSELLSDTGSLFEADLTQKTSGKEDLPVDVDALCQKMENIDLESSFIGPRSKKDEEKEIFSYIPLYLQPNNQSKLRELMYKAASKNDKAGYIYVLEIQDNNTEIVQFKVGYTARGDINERVQEWKSACRPKKQPLRGIYPSEIGGISNLLPGLVRAAAPPSPYVHRLGLFVNLMKSP